MAKQREEYDWLNDPFDEKKCAEELKQAHMSGCSKAAIALGLAAVVIIVGIAAFAGLGLMALLSSPVAA